MISSSRDEEMSSGTEEMEAELMQKAMQGLQDFRYGIAKISQGLRKFRNNSKNLNFRYASDFRYDSEIHYA